VCVCVNILYSLHMLYLTQNLKKVSDHSANQGQSSENVQQSSFITSLYWADFQVCLFMMA